MLRRTIYRQLEPDQREKRGLSLTNWILVYLIFLSLALYTVETEHQLGLSGTTLVWSLNIFILSVFCLEFILRFYAAGSDDEFKGWRGGFVYARRHWFMLAVDFVAFAPELILIAIGVVPPSWLRSLRVIRLLKMARYFATFRLVLDTIVSRTQELLAALSVTILLWYLASVLLFLAEGEAQPEQFGSITRAMWWSVVTLTTVGYGDVFPITVLGKIIAGFVAVLGLGAVALPSGIFAGAFIEKFREQRAERTE